MPSPTSAQAGDLCSLEASFSLYPHPRLQYSSREAGEGHIRLQLFTVNLLGTSGLDGFVVTAETK